MKCIYIDPPYNTGNDGFAYKDNYQHSSWLSMVFDRLLKAKPLLETNGIFVASIDDNEQTDLKWLADQVFNSHNYLGAVIWQKKYAPANDAIDLAVTHDYLLTYANRTPEMMQNRQAILTKLPRSEETNAAYKNPDDDPRGLWRADNYKSNKSADQRPNLYYAIINPFTGEEVWPNKNSVWRYTRERHEQNVTEGRVWWGKDGKGTVPAYKRFLTEVGDLSIPTIWTWEEVGHNDETQKELMSLLSGNQRFETPKPTRLVKRILQIAPRSTNQLIVLDFFAGSGTTGHAVISVNREDSGQRKYILVEFGEYFNTILKPRLQKAIYSKDWKNGRPISREGSSHLFKYIRLESYEDALNNIELKRTEEQASLLEAHDEFREDYMLRYMLEVEARGSASLLNIENFADPFNYQLNVAIGASVGETRPVAVDLVETFNYLLGLRVKHVDAIDGFRVVEGTNPEGEKVLVIWRSTREKSNDDLDQFFQKQGYNTRDRKFDLIYTNSDNNLENLKRIDETWKVCLIEEEFQRLMFDVQDV